MIFRFKIRVMVRARFTIQPTFINIHELGFDLRRWTESDKCIGEPVRIFRKKMSDSDVC